MYGVEYSCISADGAGSVIGDYQLYSLVFTID